MITATVKLESISPYSQSRYHEVPKQDRENPDDYEKRTWRERLHTDKDGNVLIPATALKNCLSEAAKFLSKQIPGKGKATYTKHFEAGVMVIDSPQIGIKKDDVRGNWLFLNADGKPGSGKRVKRCLPTIDQWSATAEFHILDRTVTEPVFKEHLEAAGMFIGIGQHRPRNRGSFGRFKVKSVKWQETN